MNTFRTAVEIVAGLGALLGLLGAIAVDVKTFRQLASNACFARADRCVCCGEIVPEGRMVCPSCERGKKK